MTTVRPRLFRLSFASLLVFAILGSVQPARSDIVLFTASTDNTGGANPISVPGTNNPNIPTIDPSVTVSPNPAFLDGNVTGPLNGINLRAVRLRWQRQGGNTGWVNVSVSRHPDRRLPASSGKSPAPTRRSAPHS